MTIEPSLYLLSLLLVSCVAVIAPPPEIPPLSNCERELPSIGEYEDLGGAFVSAVRETVPDAVPVVLEDSYTCLAQGPSEGAYRALSVVITYLLDSEATDINVGHLQLFCFDDQWVRFEELENITETVFPLDTRFDCSFCVAGINPYHCVRK